MHTNNASTWGQRLACPRLLGGLVGLSLCVAIAHAQTLESQRVGQTDPASKEVSAGEEKLTPEQLDFFETKIRPVLIENCYRCHAASEQSVRGGLSVENRDALLAGGESGAAVVPGDLESSILWQAINYRDYRMPPKGRLPDNVIADFKTWIEMGAPDPRVNQGVLVHSKVTPEDIQRQRNSGPLASPSEPTQRLRNSSLGEKPRSINSWLPSGKNKA